MILGDDYFSTQDDNYKTHLSVHPDGDYSFVQCDVPEPLSGGADIVYLNKAQAVAYAKLILRNEGIECPK